MARSTAIRQAPAAATRRLLGALVMLWSLTVSMPCAMAFDSQLDCAHCPPADEHGNGSPHDPADAHAGEHGHGSGHGIAGEPLVNCMSLQAQCAEMDGINIDIRGTSKVDQASQLPASFDTWAHTWAAPKDAGAEAGTGPPVTPPVSPPLHVIYCVYLD